MRMPTVSADWRAEILKFWFALKPEQWWKADPELDHRHRETDCAGGTACRHRPHEGGRHGPERPAAELRCPEPDRDHRQHVVETAQGMG